MKYLTFDVKPNTYFGEKGEKNEKVKDHDCV